MPPTDNDEDDDFEEDSSDPNDPDDDGPPSLADMYGYDDPEDNEEAAFDDVLKAQENGD